MNSQIYKAPDANSGQDILQQLANNTSHCIGTLHMWSKGKKESKKL